jgi:hypothetical protein
MRLVTFGGAFLLGAAILGEPAAGQWLTHPTSGIPRTPDGRPNLLAPAPRSADGKADLSGLWLPDAGPLATKGIGETLRSPYFLDITADMKPEEVRFMPWAEAEYRRRTERHSQDDPTARCQPTGVPSLNTYPMPFKIVQTPALIVVLYENNTDFRQIFTDGRAQPQDPAPTWMGYSVGHWEGDTLVVNSTGFNDRSWLDRTGHPHSEAMRVTERFRRLAFGRMEIQITIDDPITYQRPLVFTQAEQLLPDTELLEHFCTDNEKSAQHFK